MHRTLRLFCMVPLLSIAAPCSDNPLPSDQDKVRVELRLSLVRAQLNSDDKVAQVRVELWNNGDKDFIVGENLDPIISTPTYLKIDVAEANGDTCPANVITVERNMTQSNTSWTRIAPGHYYGTEAELSSRDYPCLKAPGRYKVTATYVSTGGITPASPEWQVPGFHVWSGRLTSEPVWIQVTSFRESH
jgi:hypothetical protein